MRQTLSRWSAVVAAALLSACSHTTAPDETSGTTPPGSSGMGSGTRPAGTSTGFADSASELPAATPAEASSFARASNAFGGDLYRELAAKPGNLFFSPASLATALAMTWQGARGETRDQMTKVLHFADPSRADMNGADASAMTTSAARLLVSLNDPARTDYSLSVVNRLFGEKTYGFDRGFLDVTKKQFGAELALVDFKTAFEPARADINGYVAKSTKDKIKNLIPQGGVDSDVRLVLVNAIYMNADWSTPFDKAATRRAAFHPTPDSSVDVDTMHAAMSAPMASVDGTDVIDLAYKGGDLSMTILLPKDPTRLGELEAKVAGGGLDAMLGALQPKRIELALPKFKIDPSEPMALAGTLSKMGMPLAFTAGSADFSGMSKPGEEALFISRVFHKAFVAVDEKGTEAAAASAIVMSRESAPAPAEPFAVDHPFIFTIRDTKSGLVLFSGRLVNPGA